MSAGWNHVVAQVRATEKASAAETAVATFWWTAAALTFLAVLVVFA